MSIIPEAAARLLLSRPLRCEGDVAWKPQRNGREGCILSVGLLDDTGAATAMVVELTYIHNDAVPQQAAAAFATYLTAMLALVSWEKAWAAGVRGQMPESVAK